MTEQISDLAKLARSEGDLVGEQFLHWFLQEQREEVSSMGALLTVVERSQDNVMLIEDYLAREAGGDDGADAGAPAGGRRSALGGSRDRGADVLRDGFHLDRRAGHVLQQLVRGRLLAERPQLDEERAGLAPPEPVAAELLAHEASSSAPRTPTRAGTR